MILPDRNIKPMGFHEEVFRLVSATMMRELNGSTRTAIYMHFSRKVTYREIIGLGRAGRLQIKGIGPKRNAQLEQWLQKWICPVILV